MYRSRCSVKGLLIEKNSDNVWNNTLNPEILVFSTSEMHYFKSVFVLIYDRYGEESWMPFYSLRPSSIFNLCFISWCYFLKQWHQVISAVENFRCWLEAWNLAEMLESQCVETSRSELWNSPTRRENLQTPYGQLSGTVQWHPHWGCAAELSQLSPSLYMSLYLCCVVSNLLSREVKNGEMFYF